MSAQDEKQAPTKRSPFKRVLIWSGAILLALLVLVLLLGLFPVSTDGLEPDPDPVSDYGSAITGINRILAEEIPITKPNSRSQLLTDGEKTDQVFVLIHGLTNSPKEMEELGNMLHAQGNNVLILRMPKHGLLSGSIGELDDLTPVELRDYADMAVDLATGLGERVTVIGISGGGAVAAWMAQNRPEVERAVLLSPFFGIAQTPQSLDPFLANLFSRLPPISPGGNSEPKPGHEFLYPGESSKGVAAFMRLGQPIFDQAQSTPPQASEILFLTSASDIAVDNDWATDLGNLWTQSGAQVESHEFKKSLRVPHASIDPFTDEAIRQLVYDQILEFLDETSPASS